MKTIILGLLFLFTANTMIAQNKDVKEEVTTTTTTIKDSDGERKIVEKVKNSEVQNIEFEDPNSSSLNKTVKSTPVNVTTTSEIIVDGETQYRDVDHSAYYEFAGTKYEIKSDSKGYLLFDSNKKSSSGLLRKTSNNNYIYRSENKISVGYFDKNGNLILETYDPKTDSMIREEFLISK